jgi:hydroxymethylbilane synthase
MATRGSALALAQSSQLVARLKAMTPGLEVETVIIKTSGDRFSAANPDQPVAPEGGAKGLFVKEIEEALQRGDADFAVHSGKDLPAELAEGLVIAAYPPREEARDAFIGTGGRRLSELPAGARVASSSLRRMLQVKAARPDLVLIPLRGNVDTRLRRLAEGQCEGLLLAEAGLRRLGKTDVKREVLPVDVMVPAPVQGTLAVEVTASNPEAADIIKRLDDADARKTAEFERAVMLAVGGGCSTPLGVYAEPAGLVHAFFSDKDGREVVRLSETCELTEAGAKRLAGALRKP